MRLITRGKDANLTLLFSLQALTTPNTGGAAGAASHQRSIGGLCKPTSGVVELVSVPAEMVIGLDSSPYSVLPLPGSPSSSCSSTPRPDGSGLVTRSCSPLSPNPTPSSQHAALSVVPDPPKLTLAYPWPPRPSQIALQSSCSAQSHDQPQSRRTSKHSLSSGRGELAAASSSSATRHDQDQRAYRRQPPTIQLMTGSSDTPPFWSVTEIDWDARLEVPSSRQTTQRLEPVGTKNARWRASSPIPVNTRDSPDQPVRAVTSTEAKASPSLVDHGGQRPTLTKTNNTADTSPSLQVGFAPPRRIDKTDTKSAVCPSLPPLVVVIPATPPPNGVLQS